MMVVNPYIETNARGWIVFKVEGNDSEVIDVSAKASLPI
jgi:hypothetical protein